MVSREEIRWAYLALLGREPEDDGAYLHHGRHPDFETLRRELVRSEEFRGVMRREIGATDLSSGFNYFRSMTILIHLPKTGGTALHDWFCRMLNLPYEPDAYSTYLRGLSLAELNQIEFLSGHLTFQEALAMPRQTKVMVACFREPVARLISLYRFYRSHPEDRDGSDLLPLARSLSAEDFFTERAVRASHEVDNRYLRVFTAGDHDLDRFDADRSACLSLALSRVSSLSAVAITEQLALSAERIAARLGFPFPGPPIRLQTTDDLHAEHRGFHAIEPVRNTPRLLELLEPLVRYDREIYEHALTLLARSGDAAMPAAANVHKLRAG